MSHTHDQTIPVDGTAQTVQWLYDEIMRHIEPDLCSNQIPLLLEKYKDETPREKIFRMRAYELAFAMFDACLEEIKDDISVDVAVWKQEIRKQTLEQEQLEQEEEMASIEHLLEQESANL